MGEGIEVAQIDPAPARRAAVQATVSEIVARAMAEGVLKHSPADIAVSVTGVTGSEPDDEGRRVDWCVLPPHGGDTKRWH
jgi:hypothetical protein